MLVSTASTALPVHSFDNTLGALLIGEILAAVLFGAATVQISIYCRRCERDGRVMRCAIALLWILDLVHLGFTSHSMYDYMVTNYMNPEVLLYCPWSFAANMVVGNISQVIVTGIFAYRIWKLSGKVWPLLFMIPPTLCNSAGAIAVTALLHKFPLYEDFRRRYSWIWCATFIAWTVCDCIIAVSLCTILARRRTGFQRTDSLIRTLILYTISTGALTSSIAITSAITYAVMPHNFIFIAISTILPKLHINSVFALLNSRDAMRKRISAPISIHISKLVAGLDRPAAPTRSEDASGRMVANVGVQSIEIMLEEMYVHA